MSNANQVRLSYAKETTFGTSPTNVSVTDSDISMVASDNSINQVAGDFSTDGFVAGMVVHVSGFTGDTSNNTVYEIGSVAATKMVLLGNKVVDDAIGESVTIDTGKLIDLEFTSESLTQNTDTTRSNLIRNDRQVTDVIRTDRSAGGSIDGEVKYGEYDDMLCAALYSTSWSLPVSVTGITYAMVDSGNKITDSGSGFVTAGFTANQWVKISGFTDAAHNGYFKLDSVAAGEMVLSGGDVGDEGTGDTVTITMGGYIENGTTQKTYTFEKKFQDLTNVYELFNGMAVDQMTLNVDAAAIMTCSFSFLGKVGASGASSIFGDYRTSQTTDVMNAIDDVDTVLEAGSDFSIISASIQVANNARARPQVGTLGPISLGTGTCVVTGTMRAYFADNTILDKYRNFTASSVAIVCEDGDGNGYVIEMPQVVYTTGASNATGIDTDVIADLSFHAYMDPTELKTIRIAKFAA